MGFITKIRNKICGSEEAKASTAYIICSVLQKSMALITLPIFARLLTKEELGVSTVYSSTLAVAIIFSTLNLPYGSFAPAMMKHEKDRDGYISAVNTICILFTSFYFLVYFIFHSYINNFLDLPTELMILMGFEMLFSTSTLFWMGKARFELKYKPFIIITLLTTVLGTLSSLLAVLLFPNKGIVKVIAHGVVVCMIGLPIMFISMYKGKKCLNKQYWKYALTFNIPLVPYYLSQIIFNQSDRLMINNMIGKGEAAMYGVAYQLAFVLTFILNAINNSFVPWMYKKLKENKLQENKNISIMISIIMAVLILGVIALAPEIIIIMAGEQYLPAVWVVPPVAMSLLLLFYAQLFINVEFYFEEKSKLVGASILAAVVNIVLNYFGIKNFGYIASGYTTLISYILFAICNYIAMKNICRKKSLDSNLYNIKILVVIFLVFVILGFGFAALYSYMYIRYGIIAVCLISVILLNKRIIEIINKIRIRIKS